MLEFMRKAKRQSIALDIGSDSIKMLQMQQSGGAVTVLAGARWRFPDIPVADVRQRRELAIAAVRDMLKKHPFRGRKVISSLNSQQLNIKNVRLPHMTEKELREAAMWEAKERFAFEFQPDQLNYLNAGEVRQGSETRDEVILMAVPSAVMEDHFSLLDAMGLRVEHIDAEPVALFRVFERFLRRRDDEQVISVLIDMGLACTRVVVARGRQIVFVKAIDIGGRRFNEIVASHLNLSYAEACELRVRVMRENAATSSQQNKVPGVGDPNSIQWTLFDAIRGEVESLAKEIALCLRYCSVTFRGLRCQSAILTGGESYDPAIGELLSQHLGLPCQVGQPLRGLDVSAIELGNRRGMLAEWSVCAGMAIHDLDVQYTNDEGEHGEHRLSA